MFELVKSEVLPLTPDLARQFKEMDPSPTERDLNPARLKMLRDKADKGLLITFNWSTAVLGERRLRINPCRRLGPYPHLYSFIDWPEGSDRGDAYRYSVC